MFEKLSDITTALVTKMNIMMGPVNIAMVYVFPCWNTICTSSFRVVKFIGHINDLKIETKKARVLLVVV